MANKVEWTKQQQDAIYEKNDNLLVAAAAGSGKTAVLVERIINKIINENVDIDKLLVVTFTNAAASEMRQRILDAIYKKIEENPLDAKLQRQITLLNKANICTIHSFCLEIIRTYFYELDISANFRVADTTEIELLKRDIIEDLFEEKYIKKDKAFLNLINKYTSYKDDEPLKELVLRIRNYIQSDPFPEKWLEEKIEMFNLKDNLQTDFSKTIWGQILIKEYEEVILEGIKKLESIKEKVSKCEEMDKFNTALSEDLDKLNNIYFLIESNDEKLWDKLYEKSIDFKFDRWPTDKNCTIDLKDKAKTIRDSIKDNIKQINKKIFIYDSINSNKDIYSMYETLIQLKDLIIEFENSYKDKKKEKNIVDFGDIEHFALEILLKQDGVRLLPTQVANKLKEKYVEIAIDEYQDSNLVQEYILNSISNGNNIFMVGDVKQSIYKFRQARPELFLNKYDTYSTLDIKNDSKLDHKLPGKKIKLFKNFRSRKNILDITNLIFNQIMSKDLGDIDYNQEEYLNYGAEYVEPLNNSINYAGKSELHIISIEKDDEKDDTFDDYDYNDNADIEDSNEIDSDDNEPIENTLIESKFVANKIKELLNSNYMVYDKDLGYRKVEYKDIVILLRKTVDRVPVYEKELNELDIPVYSDTSNEYLESVEIQTIMSLLKILNNPLNDVPLVTVLRSSIGNFTDNDLIKIRITDRQDSFYNSMLKSRISVDAELRKKIDNFINKLEVWKKDQEILSLDEFIWKIYSDSNYYNYVGLLNNGSIRQANLKMLFEKAKEYEKASFKGLYNFIVFINKLKTSNKDMQAAKIIGENDNVVRIMSIHKSKGLEFPIVFLCDTAKNFNMQDLNDSILLHQDLGFGPKYIDYERRIEYSTLAKEALREKMRNEIISEEMRILYVALTRAKEKLYITGVQKDFKTKLSEKMQLISMYNENKINTNLIKKYKSYLDWMQLVYLNCDELKDLISINIHESKDIDLNDNSNILNKNLLDKLNFKANDPSLINNENLNRIGDSLIWNYKYKDLEKIPTKTSVSEIKKENAIVETSLNVPKFIKEEKISGAQKGSLIHLCIENLDENKEYSFDDIKDLIDQLLNKKMITSKEAESININSILQYTKSDLFKKLKKAKKLYKEKPFYINIPAKELYDIDTDEMILTQGIIDLYFIDENDKFILVDYKTDYVEDEKELTKKYEVQLKLYKKALENSLNLKVDKTIIYSIYLQKEILV